MRSTALRILMILIFDLLFSPPPPRQRSQHNPGIVFAGIGFESSDSGEADGGTTLFLCFACLMILAMGLTFERKYLSTSDLCCVIHRPTGIALIEDSVGIRFESCRFSNGTAANGGGT